MYERHGKQPTPRDGHPEQASPQDLTTASERSDSETSQAMVQKSLEEWRERALRLQADMENFRRRQQRLAEETIIADRERLLRSLLRVADDLERALSADNANVESLRQGVNLTYQSLARLLDQEGVEPIEALGRPFDPTWHEAIGSVPYHTVGATPDTVVEVTQAGYRLGNRLLRPARVIVAA